MVGVEQGPLMANSTGSPVGRSAAFVAWAERTDPATAGLVPANMASWPHPEQRASARVRESCLGTSLRDERLKAPLWHGCPQAVLGRCLQTMMPSSQGFAMAGAGPWPPYTMA